MHTSAKASRQGCPHPSPLPRETHDSCSGATTSLAVTSAKPSCQPCLPPRRKPRGAPPAPLRCTEEAAVSHSGTLCCSRTAAKEGEALTPASPTSTANAPSPRKASARYVSGHTCDHDGVAARRDSGEIGSVMLLQGDNASLAAHVHGPCLLLATCTAALRPASNDRLRPCSAWRRHARCHRQARTRPSTPSA